MKKVLFLLTFILSGIGMATAQTSQISGVVYSEADGEPVIGASVLVVGTDLGAATDIEGKFVIADVPASATTLRVSYMGMATQEVRILRGKTIKVTLTEDGVALDDVMVVAYGTVKKSAFTGSASVVDAEKLEERQVSNITNALSGAIAGVQTTYSTGQPGTSSTVRIRGIGSLYASNNPLYVVDGIPFDGDISSINPADIESMSVLKDAAAAALYGARGANGVIMVTTKKGKTHDARITFDAKWGVNERQVPNYDVLETADSYMETLYQAYRNAGFYDLGYSPAAAHAYANNNLFDAVGYRMYTLNGADGLIGLDGKVNPLATLGYSDGKYYYTPDDWAAGSISSQMRQEYNLGVSGGTDRISYYFSAGYLEDGGIIENSGFDRLSTRLNVDYQAKKWLKFGANLAYTNTTSRYPGEQTNSSSSVNAFLLADQLAPIYPMYFRDATGKIIYDNASGRPVYDYGNGYGAENEFIPFARNYMSMANPVSDLFYNTEDYLMDILNGKWFAEITPLKGLKLTASLGTHIDNTRYHNVGNPKYGQSAQYGGTTYYDYTRTFALNQQYLATYNKTYGKSTYDALVGYEAYDLRGENVYASGQNLYKPNDFTINNTIDQKRGGGSAYEYSTRGILGRFNYNYDEKYFASASYRRDASSRFHPDNRWGNFWSASAAWVLSKEYFMNDVDWVDILKVKASFGQQGNDDIKNYYAYLDQYAMTGADGVFADGNLVYKGNKDISWEKSNSFNAGVDFSLWKSKLSGTVEYFNRTTSDMLYYKHVAVSNGYTEIPMNIGSMANSGVEVELNATPVELKKFRWDVYANGTFVKNKIIALHPELNGKYIDGSTIYEEGESMYQYYFIKYAGVDPNSGKALYYAKTTMSEDEAIAALKQANADVEDYEPTDKEIEERINYFNENEYEVYLTDDVQTAQSTYREATGDLLPKVYGGFGTSLEFHGFDLSVQLAYQLGGKVYDNTYATLMHNGDANNAGKNWHKDIANAWTPENRITNVPRLDMMDKYTNSQSDRWLVSSNYLALNSITLGYTFPKAWLRGAGISSLRIYGAADNVALLSARKGLDPRKGLSAVTGATYGALRTFSAGVKLTF